MTDLSRRVLLLAGAGITLSACSSSRSAPPKTLISPSPSPSPSLVALTGDLALVGLAAAVENALIYAYQQGINAANAGALGLVPPSMVTLLTTVKAHHVEHATSWNGFLDKNKKPMVSDFPLTQARQLIDSLTGISDLTALATVLLHWETTAAATYIQAAGTFSAPAGITTGLSIAPVEAEHACVLSFLLGKQAAPAALYDTSLGLDVSSYTG